uniref:SMR family transporter n=1 Tax=Helicobacter sp. TaxID=218 RepID=UPI00388D0F4D
MHSQKLLAWTWLLLAIITEVLGSSFLKLAQSMSYGFLVTAFFICVSYYFIGLAIKRISVSVAYAMWEVLGVICIVLIGIWYFDENLALVQYAGIVCAVVGILLINFGEIDSGDSALGEQCGSVAPFAEGTNAKFANLPQKAQSSHSPTANLRILEEDKQARCENPTQILESHSGFTKTAQTLESTFCTPHTSKPSALSFVLLSAGLMGVVALSLLGYAWHSTPAMLGFAFVCIAAVLDVVANLLLKASNGFSKLGYGLGAVGVVIGAFYLLMLALDSMELAVAYSSWGAIGIIGTIAGGRILFGER